MAAALRGVIRFVADYPFVTHCLAPLSDRPIVPRDNCAMGAERAVDPRPAVPVAQPGQLRLRGDAAPCTGAGR